MVEYRLFIIVFCITAIIYEERADTFERLLSWGSIGERDGWLPDEKYEQGNAGTYSKDTAEDRKTLLIVFELIPSF